MSRSSKLTAEIATKLEYYWQLSSEVTLTDQDICSRLGIKHPQLKAWLQRDLQVKREDGTIESIGALRARARASGLTSYLQRHHALLIKAENAGDLKTAHAILCWLEVKQHPRKFNVLPQAEEAQTRRTGVMEVPAAAESTQAWQKRNEQKTKPT